MIVTKTHSGISFGKDIKLQIIAAEKRHVHYLSTLIRLNGHSYESEGFGKSEISKKVVNTSLEEKKILIEGPSENIKSLFMNIAGILAGISKFFREHQDENIEKLFKIAENPEEHRFTTLI